MKRILLAVLMLMSVTIGMSGCGDGGEEHPLVVTRILSDETVDGDIKEDTNNVLTVNTGVSTLFAGVDPANLDEYRAFVDFPLHSIPLSGLIQSATLNITIDSVTPFTATVPITLELVAFNPPLQPGDFDRTLLPPLAVTTVPISGADLNSHVLVDVTSLMRVAQARALPNFQLRILEDLNATSPGLIEIDDSTNETAPRLTVTYF